MGTPAPDAVKRLVDLSACNAQADHFDQSRKVFLSPDYKEEQLHVSSGPSPSIRHSSFVIRSSPHESLGWDVANKAGLTEVFGCMHDCPLRSAHSPELTSYYGGPLMEQYDANPLGFVGAPALRARRPVLLALSLASSLMITASGCVSSIRYVVVSDVPPSPSFTVIPASTSHDDDASANAITEELVGLGIRVVERPALVRQRTEYKGTTSGTGVGVTLDGQLSLGGTGGTQAGDVTTSVDPVALIQESQADYIVFTKPGPWLKVVRRKDSQIVFAGSLAADSNNGCCLSPAFWRLVQPERDRLRNMLRNLGVATN